MKHGVPTTNAPDCPECLYMRNLYHEFFWGPFASEAEVIAAINTLDAADDHWDYDPFAILWGSNPLPKDFVFGFRFVDDTTRERIFAGRLRK